MRIAAHIASLAALVTLGLALGRWLREPNAGGLVFLLLLCAAVGLALRHLYGSEPAPEAPPPDPRVDLNTAGVDELRRLPGVGSVAAQRIVDERDANGPFESVEALTRVPGFGPAKVRVLAPDARV